MQSIADHFFALTPDLLCIADGEGRLLRVSASWEPVLGYRAAELEGRFAGDFLHPEDLAATLGQFAGLPGAPRARSFLNRWRHSDGSWRWLEWSVAWHDELIYAAARDITARQAAQEALERQQRLLAEAERVAGVGTWLLDEASGKVTWSDQLFRITGRDRALPAPGFDEYLAMFTPESQTRLLAAFRQDREAPATHDLELELVRPGGQHVNVVARTEGVLSPDGRRLYTQGTILDVTEHRRAEESLRANEAQLRAVWEQAPLGVALVEVPTGRFLRVNPRFCEIVGRTERELAAVGFREITHPEDLAHSVDSMRRLMGRDLNRDSVEKRYLRPDGGSVWVSVTVVPLLRSDPDHQVHLAMVEDITARKRIAAALAESEHRLRAHIEQTPVAVIEWDEDFHITDWNPAAERIFGFPAAEALGETGDLLLPEGTRGQVAEVFGRILRGEGGQRNTNENVTRDRRTIVCEWFNTPLTASDGRVIGVASIAEDVTERIRALEALEESEYALKEAQRVASVGSWHWAADTDTITWSTEYHRMIGHDPQEPPPGYEEHLKWYTPESAARLDAAVTAAMKAGTPYELDLDLIRSDGERLAVVARAEAVRDETGKVIILRGTLQDITERKRLEEEHLALERRMLEVEHLERLGLLAGGIAHDFNNLLQAILGNAALLAIEISRQNEPVRTYLQEIEKAAVRAADLSRQMLAFSGQSLFVLERLDLNSLVASVAAAFQPTIPATAVVEQQLGNDLPAVDADIGQLRQVLTSLLANSAEAIGDLPGLIVVRTSAITRADAQIGEGASAAGEPQQQVLLEVSDTGCGMDREAQAKIFEPFYTTKLAGRGLGMAGVLGIVRRLHGQITVDSEPGRGTTIRILLPAAAREA